MNYWSMTTLSAACSLLILTAFVLWWAIRIRLHKMRMPILRILQYRPSRKPRIALRPPPLIPFLCFLFLCLCLLLLTFRPGQTIHKPFSTQGSTVHIFADMSPSVSAYKSLPEYRENLTGLFNQLSETKNISFSTSHSDEIVTIQNKDQLDQYLSELTFHRAGSDLGSLVKKQWAKMTKPDRYIILSDQDAHSWQNFNWQFLNNETELWYTNLSHSDEINNIFFQQAHYLSPPVTKVMNWDITIARSGTLNQQKGILRVSWVDSQLAAVPWDFAQGQAESTLRVSWPSSEVQQTDNMLNPPLIWELQPDEEDAISSDNTFRTSLKGREQKIILIAESGGEQVLESPTHSLQMAQEILGIRPERFDRIVNGGPPASQYPLWILYIGAQKDINSFCPASLFDYRNSTQNSRQSKIKVWMSPYKAQKEAFRNICWCYHRTLLSQSRDSKKPAYCDEIYDQGSFFTVLRSIGARQIGGEAGQGEGAIAWEGEDEHNRLKVMAFTIPLRPSRKTGLGHAQLPLMIKNLMQLEGFHSSSQSHHDQFARIEDNSTHEAWFKDNNTLRESRQSLQSSNVPVGESSLQTSPAESFPPRWPDQFSASNPAINMQKKHHDPLPWIYGMISFILLITLTEIFYAIYKRKQFDLSRVKKWGLLCLLYTYPHPSSGITNLNITGFKSFKGFTARDLAYQVANRTSLSLSADILNYPEPEPKLFANGWIWSSGLSPVSGSGGHALPEVSSWIRKGGFLIVEKAHDPDKLKSFTSQGFQYLKANGTWNPIPPDHEIMRSFYLIDALPGCQWEIWQGFHFDQRLAILAIPYDFLESLSHRNGLKVCGQKISYERLVRIFINILMVALTTDYKKDQIHMREILKRL